TSKCGPQRVRHWAHSRKRTCDPWWKSESEWHRAWKKHFPLEWHEFIHQDHSHEKHIADVRTEHGLIVEFQNSPIDPQERTSRARFCGNMVWVVNGMRHKGVYPRFLKGNMHFEPTTNKRFFLQPVQRRFFLRHGLRVRCLSSSIFREQHRPNLQS